jgi:hypothetical protein
VQTLEFKFQIIAPLATREWPEYMCTLVPPHA